MKKDEDHIAIWDDEVVANDIEITIGDHVAKWRSSAVIPGKPLLYRGFRQIGIQACAA